MVPLCFPVVVLWFAMVLWLIVVVWWFVAVVLSW